MFDNLKEGDEVFVVYGKTRWQTENRKETKVVTKVGRTYAYLSDTEKFYLEDGKSAHKSYNMRVNGYGFDVYPSEDDYLEQLEFEETAKVLAEKLYKLHKHKLLTFPKELTYELDAILDNYGVE